MPYKSREREYVQKYVRGLRERNKNNPEWINKQREYQRKSQLKIRNRHKNDPAWMAKERERQKLKSKKQRDRDPVAYNKKLRKWRAGNQASVLTSQTKARAKKIAVECDIDIVFVKMLLSSIIACPYTKVMFSMPKPNGLRMNPWAPSLDRIDSTKGYTRNNIELVSNWWNLAKHEWPAEVVALALAGLRS